MSKYYLGIFLIELFYKLTGQQIDENKTQKSPNHFVTKLSFHHNVIQAENKNILSQICLAGHEIHEKVITSYD